MKQTSEVRIALLGDSMTMGWGLLRNETVSRQLEHMLQADNSTARIQVINAGQFGYGPIQELSLLEEIVGPLEPDIIVLELFMGNDVADSAQAVGTRLRSHNLEALLIHELMARDSDPCYRANRWLREFSRAYQMLARAIGNAAPICSLVRPDGSPPPIEIGPNEPRPDWLEVDLLDWYPELEQGWEATKEGVRGIRRYCEERGIELYVYVLPSLSDLSLESFRSAISYSGNPEAYEYGKGTRLAEEFFREESFASIDVRSSIMQNVSPELAFFPWAGHLTPRGANDVATAISRQLRGTSNHFSKIRSSGPSKGPSAYRRIEIEATGSRHAQGKQSDGLWLSVTNKLPAATFGR